MTNSRKKASACGIAGLVLGTAVGLGAGIDIAETINNYKIIKEASGAVQYALNVFNIAGNTVFGCVLGTGLGAVIGQLLYNKPVAMSFGQSKEENKYKDK